VTIAAAAFSRRQTDPAIRVLLADDQRLFRQVLKMAIDTEPGIDVVAEAHDGPGAVREARRVMPDVVVVDAKLARDVHAITRELLEAVPSCRVVVLAHDDDERFVHEALQSGASGCLSKSSSVGGLASGVRSVHRGHLEIQPGMLRPLLHRLLNRWQEQEEVFRKISQLSRREREVLRLLAVGAGTTEIARGLYVSPATVRTHIQNVITKLEVHSRVEVATFVTRHQVLQNLDWML